MKWLGLTILAICFAINTAVRDPDGKLRLSKSEVLKIWDGPSEIKSADYPSAPRDLIQTWNFKATGGNEYPDKALKLFCSGLNLPEDAVLSWKDGPLNKEWRGKTGRFTVISESSDVTLTLTTGREGVRLFCTINAIYVDKGRNEVTTTTTIRPGDYWFIPSEEVDSSEHGGEAGEKSTTCQCGWANKFGSRIVNGTETNRNEFPFAAALIERDSRERFCGSTIITEYHAITAAHCTEKTLRENTPTAIIVGIHNLKDVIKPPTEIIEVERTMPHPGYTGKPFYKHDLTLLFLKTKITFGPQVGPACLPTHQVNLDRQYIKVIGWGGISLHGPQSDYLRKVNVRVVPMDECHHEYISVDVDNPTQICTYAKRGASCNGDSGGPVIWLDPDTNRYTLVGAVSFGFQCGAKPSVATAIGHYLDWIQHYVKVSKGSSICQKVN